MEKREWKFTFRDTLLILLIILIAVVFVQKMITARALDRADDTFEIILRGEVKEPFMRDQIKVGDQVYQKGSPVVFGVVTSVSTEPATMDSVDVHTGEYKVDEVTPNMYHLVITLQSTGFSSVNGTAIIDNNMITLNQYLVINTNRVHLPTRVMSIVTKG